mmetsp:Transcript_29047/g.27839  ORF Transcript_29047/g.27839 Transcript_29047/m.27839 type:complete len:623 (-) Transcript_29047:267-2135(-)
MVSAVLVFLAISITLWTVCEAHRLGDSSFSTALRLRAGRTSKSSTRKNAVRTSSSSSRRKKPSKTDDDDDEDEDDDNDYKNNSKNSRSSSKNKGSKSTQKSSQKNKNSRSKMEMVPWGKPSGRKGKKSKSIGIREKLEELAKHGQSAYKDVYRRAKVLRSSAFEGMLLKATWPGSEAVPENILSEIIKHSIPAFKYGRSSSEDDPYHMTLHKLWTKMCEKDWRTVVKSLYVLHMISRECSTDACERFAAAIKSLARTRNPKNPDHKYFALSPIADVDHLGEMYSSFIRDYAAYVIFRAKTFSGKFQDIKDINEESSEIQVLAKLKKLMTCITNGLKCFVVERKQQNPIIGHATKVIANDLKDMLKLLSDKMAPMVGQGDPYAGPKGDEKEILALLQFYQESNTQIKAYLSKATKAYTVMRVKIPTAVESKVSVGKLESRIAELTKITGGATKMMTARKLSRSLARHIEEDDEEEEDEEEEDEEDDDDDDDEDEEIDTSKDEEEEDDDDEEGEGEEESELDKEEEKEVEDDDEDEEEDDEDEEEPESESELLLLLLELLLLLLELLLPLLLELLLLLLDDDEESESLLLLSSTAPFDTPSLISTLSSPGGSSRLKTFSLLEVS